MKQYLFPFLLFFGFLNPLVINAQVDRDLVALGNDMYRRGNSEDALEMYKQAIALDNTNAEAHLMAGKCYRQTTCCKKQAIDEFLVAYTQDPTISRDIYYLIADGYHISYQFDEAIEYYQKYMTELEVNRRGFIGINVDSEIKKAKRGIYECQNGNYYMTTPSGIAISNMGDEINSAYEDYAPTISPDEDEIYFTSKRPGSVGGNKDSDNKYFEDIWYSKKTDESWSEPTNLGAPINDEYHNSNIGLSPDATKLFIYSNDNSGDILRSEHKNGTWTKPKSVGNLINSEYRESSISITKDGAMMFYTSSKPGGEGSTDIYFCYLDVDGNCLEDPKNLGTRINTEYAEEGPFYDVENNKLYFASKGHKGMGGFDLYETYYDETSDTWSEPLNLGIPVNSTDDDLFITLSADGRTAYYSTFKEDSRGYNDIYKIFPLNRDERDSILLAQQKSLIANQLVTDTQQVEPEISNITCQLKITVTDENDIPIEADLHITDKQSSATLANQKKIENGVYSYTYDQAQERDLILTAEHDGYFYQTSYLAIKQANDGQNIEIGIQLRPARALVIRPLRNVYFGFDKRTLTPASFIEIDKLANMMKNDEHVYIEIAGHTDIIGTKSYNKNLSQYRAEAVRRALIDKGIDAQRIKAIGYGETQPLATNDDEQDGRELNRRTEFIIIPH